MSPRERSPREADDCEYFFHDVCFVFDRVFLCFVLSCAAFLGFRSAQGSCQNQAFPYLQIKKLGASLHPASVPEVTFGRDTTCAAGRRQPSLRLCDDTMGGCLEGSQTEKCYNFVTKQPPQAVEF